MGYHRFFHNSYLYVLSQTSQHHAFATALRHIFLAIAIKHNFANHYLKTELTFGIFLILLFVEKIANKWHLTNAKLCSIGILSMTLTVISAKGAIGDKYFFFQDNGRKEYYDAAYLMAQRHNPTILYADIDIGIGMPVGCLPSTLYWIKQVGVTDEMKQSRKEAIAKHKPDFIFANKYDKEEIQQIVVAGYQYYLTIPVPVYSGVGYELYGPKGLKLPPKDFCVSDMDILLKRRIIFHNR